MTPTPKKDSFLGRLKRGGIRNRVYARFDCNIRAELVLPEKALSLDGVLTEISRGGIRFREASSWILDRRGQPVIVRLPWLDLPGTIVNVGSTGYGIRLDRLLREEALEAFLTRQAA